MSRVGRAPITVPAGVTVTIADGNLVTVKGPKGEMQRTFNPNLTIKQEGTELLVTRPNDSKEMRSLHGTTRALLHNMVVGCHETFTKTLQVNGIGYRVEKKGNAVTMKLGYSHDVVVEEIPGITMEVPDANTIVVRGCDKQAVGQFAAVIRGKRPPEPYKGKGIKYADEVIRRKEGKTGAKKK
ncbi:MAG: 50S ribosomal protein L6 [Clostridiales bacterium]|nr:50S ribosomal protein L6 [Clostridiales bacterium]MCC8100562.1 50S ribosomal protein L6 [Clostridiales bacterium]